MLDIYTLFGVLIDDNTREYFTKCLVFTQIIIIIIIIIIINVKIGVMSKMFSLILSTKKPNKRFIIPLHFVKPGLDSVIRWHTLRVLLPLYGKMTQQWSNKR